VAEQPGASAQLSIDQGVARVTLNRPERLNAFNMALHADLRALFDQIESQTDLGAVVITGAGRAFCAGQDLGERADMLSRGDVDLGASLERNYNPLVRRIAALPVPVIAAVNGTASGAGAALAISCDIVLAARSATFEFAFARVGLGPDCGASWTLPRLIGRARALGMALTSHRIDATEAERIGLIWRAIDDADFAGEVTALAQRFAAGSRGALAATKRRLRAAQANDFDTALDAERDEQAGLGRGDDYREAVTAFMAKRPPIFSHHRKS